MEGVLLAPRALPLLIPAENGVSKAQFSSSLRKKERRKGQKHRKKEGPEEGRKAVRIRQSLMEKAMAPHSSTLAWKIPWTEEPARLRSMGSLRVGHD